MKGFTAGLAKFKREGLNIKEEGEGRDRILLPTMICSSDNF